MPEWRLQNWMGRCGIGRTVFAEMQKMPGCWRDHWKQNGGKLLDILECFYCILSAVVIFTLFLRNTSYSFILDGGGACWKDFSISKPFFPVFIFFSRGALCRWLWHVPEVDSWEGSSRLFRILPSPSRLWRRLWWRIDVSRGLAQVMWNGIWIWTWELIRSQPHLTSKTIPKPYLIFLGGLGSTINYNHLIDDKQ